MNEHNGGKRDQPASILLPGGMPQEEAVVPISLTILNSSLASLDPAEADAALLYRLAGLLASGVQALTDAAARKAPPPA